MGEENGVGHGDGDGGSGGNNNGENVGGDCSEARIQRTK